MLRNNIIFRLVGMVILFSVCWRFSLLAHRHFDQFLVFNMDDYPGCFKNPADANEVTRLVSLRS